MPPRAIDKVRGYNTKATRAAPEASATLTSVAAAEAASASEIVASSSAGPPPAKRIKSVAFLPSASDSEDSDPDSPIPPDSPTRSRVPKPEQTLTEDQMAAAQLIKEMGVSDDSEDSDAPYIDVEPSDSEVMEIPSPPREPTPPVSEPTPPPREPTPPPRQPTPRVPTPPLDSNSSVSSYYGAAARLRAVYR